MERQGRDIENPRQEIQEFVDALAIEQVRRLMVLLINNGRGSLDFARRLVTRENSDEEPQLRQIMPYPDSASATTKSKCPPQRETNVVDAGNVLLPMNFFRTFV